MDWVGDEFRNRGTTFGIEMFFDFENLDRESGTWKDKGAGDWWGKAGIIAGKPGMTPQSQTQNRKWEAWKPQLESGSLEGGTQDQEFFFFLAILYSYISGP